MKCINFQNQTSHLKIKSTVIIIYKSPENSFHANQKPIHFFFSKCINLFVKNENFIKCKRISYIYIKLEGIEIWWGYSKENL